MCQFPCFWLACGIPIWVMATLTLIWCTQQHDTLVTKTQYSYILKSCKQFLWAFSADGCWSITVSSCAHACQHILWWSVQLLMQLFTESVYANWRMVGVPYSWTHLCLWCVQTRGRQGRIDFTNMFETVYHFRLLYNKPYFFPIYGALRYVYGEQWEIYKRTTITKTVEIYNKVTTVPKEPTPAIITKAIRG